MLYNLSDFFRRWHAYFYDIVKAPPSTNGRINRINHIGHTYDQYLMFNGLWDLTKKLSDLLFMMPISLCRFRASA